MFKRYFAILFFLLAGRAAQSQDKYPQMGSGKSNKTIYTDSLGKQIGEAYDYGQPFYDGRAVVTKTISQEKQLNGVIDATGKYVLPPEDRFLLNYGLGLIGSEKQGADFRLYNGAGKLIYTCGQCRPEFLKDLKMVYLQTPAYEKKPANATLIDLDGKIKFSINTERLERINNNRFLTDNQYAELPMPYFLITKQSNYGWYNAVVDVNGKIRIDSTSAFRFENNFAVIQESKNARVVDTLFRDVISSEAGYEWAMMLNQHPQRGIAVKKNGRYGVVDPSNKILVPIRSAHPIEYRPYEKHYLINNSNYDTSYVLSLELDTIVSPELQLAPNHSPQGLEGPVVSYKKGATWSKYGYRDAKGKMTIPCMFDYLSPMQNDSMVYFRGDTAGFISTTGKRLFKFPVPCAGAGWIKDGRALCVQSFKSRDSIVCYWVDRKGQKIGKQAFTGFAPFVGGLAMVNVNNDYFFVDSSLQRVKFNDKYDYRTYYNKDFAGITDGKYFGIVHRSGKIVLPVEYDMLDAELVEERYGTEFEKAFPHNYFDKTGQNQVVPGSLLIPKIVDGKLEVKKNGNKFLIDLSSLEAAGAGPTADTLNQWYKVNPIYQDDEGFPQHPKLVTDKSIKIIPSRRDDQIMFMSTTSGLPVSPKTFDVLVELNRYGAIAISNGRYNFINNEGKVLLENYELIKWDNEQLEARNYGAYAKDLPEQNSFCYKSEYYDVKGNKKFEQLWHDHADYRTDSIAYFRFGRNLSIVGRSGKVYLKERLIEGNPFKAICHNRLVYVLSQNEKIRWAVFDVFKREQYSLQLPVDAEIGPYKINDTLFGYYDTYGIRHFVNAQGREMPFILEPDIISKDEQWGTYFAQDEFIVMQKEGRRFGLMHRSGKMIIPFRYKAMGAFSEDYAFCQDSTYAKYLINRQGKVCFSDISEEDLYLQGLTWQSFTFHEGLALGTANCGMPNTASSYQEQNRSNCYYYRDTTGKVVLSLPKKYIIVGNFSEGLAAVVNKEMKLGYINQQGKEVIACTYPIKLQEQPLPFFKAGYAYLFNQKGYIDKKGKPYFK